MIEAGRKITEADLVPGRTCGPCSLCCKVMRIDEVESPGGKWCRHCMPGKGCSIHATRPDVCRGFFCLWLQREDVPAYWRPEKSKMVLCLELDGRRIAAHVDTGTPDVWRRSPFYEDLKRWSAAGIQAQRQVSVWLGRRAIVILPDRDIDLGIVGEDEVVISTGRMTPQGPVFGAEKVKQSDLPELEAKWAAARRSAGM